MTKTKRVHGFVSGNNAPKAGKPYWVVQVEDEGSEYNNQEVIVKSFRPGTPLKRIGQDVTFLLENDGPGVFRAFDVCVGLNDTDTGEVNSPVAQAPRSLSFAVTQGKNSGKIVVFETSSLPPAEARKTYGKNGLLKFIGFVQITPELVLNRGVGDISESDASGALAKIINLAEIPAIEDAFCALVAEALLLGRSMAAQPQS